MIGTFIMLIFGAAVLGLVQAQSCDRTYVLKATGIDGQYGYPTQINLPHPRTNPCVIKLINEDVWEHGISPVKPADGSYSLAGFYFGGQVVYPTTTSGLGGQEIQITVQPDWPEGTYEYYCVFHGTRGKIVLGTGAGCTLPVAGCIPTDPPTPVANQPCGQNCENLVAQLPTCSGDTQISYIGSAYCHIETKTCKFPTSSVNCAIAPTGAPTGATCRNGVCVPVGGDPNPLPDTGFCLPCNNPPPNDCVTIGGHSDWASLKPAMGKCGINAVGGYQCNYSPSLNVDCRQLNAYCKDGACVSNIPQAPSPAVSPPTIASSPTIAGSPTVAGGAPTTAPAPTTGSAPSPASPTSQNGGCLTSAQCTSFCSPYGYDVCECARVSCKDPSSAPVVVPQGGIRYTFPDDGTIVHVDGTGKTYVIAPDQSQQVAVTEPLGDGKFTATTPSGQVFTVDPSSGTVTRGGVAPSTCLVAPFEKCNALCKHVLNCSCDSFECLDDADSAAASSRLKLMLTVAISYVIIII